jgi:DNA-binding Lrp family transcriptional regulator
MNLDLVNDIQQQDKDAVKLLHQRGELTVPMLSKLTGLGETKCKRILERLSAKGICHAVRVKNRIFYKQGAAPIVDLSEKYKPTGRFEGIRWEPNDKRPGCQEFLKCLSRVDNRFIPHRPMIHALV